MDEGIILYGDGRVCDIVTLALSGPRPSGVVGCHNVTKCSPNLPDLSVKSVTMSQRNPRFPWLPRIRGEWERGIRGFRGFKNL